MPATTTPESFGLTFSRYPLALVSVVLFVLALPPFSYSFSVFISLSLLGIACYRTSLVRSLGLIVFYGFFLSAFFLFLPTGRLSEELAINFFPVLVWGVLAAGGLVFFSRFHLWVVTSSIYLTFLSYLFAIYSWGAGIGESVAISQAWGTLVPVTVLGGATLLVFVVSIISFGLSEIILSLMAKKRNPLHMLTVATSVCLVIIFSVALPTLLQGTGTSYVDGLERRLVSIQNIDEPTRYVKPFLSNAPDGFAYAAQWTLDYEDKVVRNQQPPADMYVWPQRTASLSYITGEDGRETINKIFDTVDVPILFGVSDGATALDGKSLFLLALPWSEESQVFSPRGSEGEDIYPAFFRLNDVLYSLIWGSASTTVRDGNAFNLQEEKQISIIQENLGSRPTTRSQTWQQASSNIFFAKTGHSGVYISGKGSSVFFSSSGNPLYTSPQAPGYFPYSITPTSGVTLSTRLEIIIPIILLVFLAGSLASATVSSILRRKPEETVLTTIKR